LDLKQYLERRRRRVDEALDRWVAGEEEFPAEVHRAMRYSLFAGGKRLRPILALAAAEAAGGKAAEAMPVACALELIHTYSLIHDDLPAMDDDDLRRGRPTSHRVFGEATAILAGDALLTEAFRLMARQDLMKSVSAPRRLRAIYLVAAGSGSRGMVGGQAVDIASEGKAISAETLEYIHSRKTGALIEAAVSAGAVVGGGSPREVSALEEYGRKTGLAFQIIDDLLDVQGDPSKMGKAAGKDRARGKATYPAFFGIADSRRRAERLVQEALASLDSFRRRAEPLREIARYILQRKS
jgi:geranylgeranyl diphosphate synthase, type II